MRAYTVFKAPFRLQQNTLIREKNSIN